MIASDPAKSAQADSPYYDVVEPAPSGFEQTHSVIKKHHKGVEKEGDICLSWFINFLSMFRILNVPA